GPGRGGRRAPPGRRTRPLAGDPYRPPPLRRAGLLTGDRADAVDRGPTEQRGRVRVGGPGAGLPRRAAGDGGVRGVGLAGRHAALAARRRAAPARDDGVVAVRVAEG